MSNEANQQGTGSPEPGPTSLRERLAALGERLDAMTSSGEVQELRQRVLQAADDIEGRMREARLGERLEQGANEVSQYMRQMADSTRGQELGERVRGVADRIEQDLGQTLSGPRGQELRDRLAGWFEELAGRLRVQTDRGPAEPAAAHDAAATGPTEEPDAPAAIADEPGESRPPARE